MCTVIWKGKTMKEKDSKYVVEHRIRREFKKKVLQQIVPPKGYEFLDSIYLDIVEKGFFKNLWHTEHIVDVENHYIKNGQICRVVIQVHKKELLDWSRKLVDIIKSINKEIEVELIRDFDYGENKK